MKMKKSFAQIHHQLALTMQLLEARWGNHEDPTTSDVEELVDGAWAQAERAVERYIYDTAQLNLESPDVH